MLGPKAYLVLAGHDFELLCLQLFLCCLYACRCGERSGTLGSLTLPHPGVACIEYMSVCLGMRQHLARMEPSRVPPWDSVFGQSVPVGRRGSFHSHGNLDSSHCCLLGPPSQVRGLERAGPGPPLCNEVAQAPGRTGSGCHQGSMHSFHPVSESQRSDRTDGQSRT